MQHDLKSLLQFVNESGSYSLLLSSDFINLNFTFVFITYDVESLVRKKMLAYSVENMLKCINTPVIFIILTITPS
jgi:hypothetical protein